MSKIILRRRWSGLMAAGFAALLPTVFGVGAPASAAPATNVIVLPGATSAEGIAVGDGATFYAGDLFTGDIYRGDLQRGTAGLLTDAPAGRMAAGMKLDRRSGLLYVAGAFTGQAYVYDGATGATVAAYQFGVAGQSVINDVIVTREGAWFTDSVAPKLYFVPISPTGAPGGFSVLTVTGPAAEISGDFNLNGIAATPDGLTLIVAPTRPTPSSTPSTPPPAPVRRSTASACRTSTGSCSTPGGCGPYRTSTTRSPGGG